VRGWRGAARDHGRAGEPEDHAVGVERCEEAVREVEGPVGAGWWGREGDVQRIGGGRVGGMGEGC
jgi:hypothetical protein